MKAIFVAGTDTGVGKTVVTGLLARYLSKKGYRVVTQKWVETGCARGPSDIEMHCEWMGKRKADFAAYLKAMAPYSFRFAASPHLSARLEKKTITSRYIYRCFKELSGNFDFIIIEGSGGLLVPLDQKILMIDLVRKIDLPVLLVAGNKLGAINSTLLSIEALRSRRIKLCGIIFNEYEKGADKKIVRDNPAIVGSLGNARILGSLPTMRTRNDLSKRFMPIGKRIEAAL